MEFKIIWMQLLLGQVASRAGTEVQIYFDYPMLVPEYTVIYTTKIALKNFWFKKREKCLSLMEKG